MAHVSMKKERYEHDDSGVVLLLQVPRTNDKKELAAEQMFASLHGLLTIPTPGILKAAKRERLSFEIAVRKKRIGFYVWVPNYLKTYVEEQIYAQYPTVHITEIEDYAAHKPEQHYQVQLVTELRFTGNNALPIKTFQSFEVDPLAAITATLAKFSDDEEAWLQLLIRPASSNWHRASERYVARMRSQGGTTTTGMLSVLWAPPETKTDAGRLSDDQQTRVSAAEQKTQKLAFETQVRIVYRGNAPKQQAQLQMQSIVASYKQFNSTYLNGFEARRVLDDPFLVAHYRARAFNKTGFMCNIEEVATLYHLPHTSVETPYIMWATSQTAEPPANLPLVTPATQDVLSPVAATNFRGHNTMFGLPRVDRSRHLYIIGQTGTGKSAMLELLTISDIYSPYGFAVIDPHGDYAQSVLKRIPPERAADVVYFNPADTDFPMGFNPLEIHDPKLKTHTSSELIGVIKRMFEHSWGPRLEYILRYCLLALLDYPQATMLDITRMLTDKKFRADVLQYVQDPVVRNFWTIEFASWNDKFMTEAVAPILNKVGAFTANPLVRNIIGQPKSSFNIRQIMDERKILIVNLSRGLVGEDNAALLGALLVTKVQLAAMSRADIASEQRTPFYLYVDEFQNFATDSFATILSEARKYGLSLTVANQYIAQMLPEVKDAVFGNVGSIISFRTSADDAHTMLKYFEPKFTDYDLVHMHNRHFAISMTIDGEKVPAFSAISLNLPSFQFDYSPQIVQHSRGLYAQPRHAVEQYVSERYGLHQSVKPTATEKKPTEEKQPESKKPQALDKSTVTLSKEDASEKPKRKRTRKRKKKTSSEEVITSRDQQTSGVMHEEHVIRLK
ncbi:type IV secretion system DNA-binding domain-containing protein [Candidatus Saccharibacteria bacterium]|nr:type IV secretion system DNA-binding domain-containing protein [Candidatus Saccharibacteria bacterium]